jgi:DNA-binding XRE family transcriptional regulator
MAAELCDLCRVRESLGKSQSEMASLLGISIRAVQSYEQGWRPTPALIQKMAAFLLFMNHRRDHETKSCYDLCGCSEEAKQGCPGAQMCHGNACWLVTDTVCQGKKLKSWKAKAAKCRKCPVMAPWLPA